MGAFPKNTQFHIIAAFAEFEREVIRERIKSGVIAKQQKIKIGQDTWRGRGPDKEKRKPRSDRGLKRGKYNLKKLGTRYIALLITPKNPLR